MNLWHVLAKANLEQQRGEPDCRHYDESDRTEKSCRACVDHDQRKRQNKQPGGDHGPSAR